MSHNQAKLLGGAASKAWDEKVGVTLSGGAMKKIKGFADSVYKAGKYSLYGLVIAAAVASPVKAIPVNITLEQEQIENSGFPWYYDTWFSGWEDIVPDEVLQPEVHTLKLDFNFDKYLKSNDELINSNESIKFKIDGSGIAAFMSPYNKLEYEYWFTGIKGKGGPPSLGTEANPITGDTNISANGNVDYSIDLDLVDGKFFFSGIHLEIIPFISQDWTIDKVQVGYDADEVTIVPEPATMMLLAVGSLALMYRRKDRQYVESKVVEK